MSEEEHQVRELVVGFSERMRLVNLSAPTAIVTQNTKEAYADYVSSELLAQWQANPLDAPGRLTSSPWPDRIEITSVVKGGQDSYIVQGNIIEITSKELVEGGVAAKYLAVIQIDKINGTWLVVGFDKGPYSE